MHRPQRHEPRSWYASLGDDDLLARGRPIDQLGEVRFCVVDIHLLRHASAPERDDAESSGIGQVGQGTPWWTEVWLQPDEGLTDSGILRAAA